MDTQEAYEIIRNHFSQPDARYGWNEQNKECVYRTPDGANRCAFGVLLPDGLYDPCLEGTSVGSLLNAPLYGWECLVEDGTKPRYYDIEKLREHFWDCNIKFLEQAQIAHDECAEGHLPLSSFIERLDRLAVRFDLTVPA